MKKESPDNIVGMCKECSDKARADWQKRNIHTNIEIGDVVKIPFRDAGKVEHMWVIIKEINGNNLKGTLDNEPIQVFTHMYGDEVEFTLKDVEDLIKKNDDSRFED